MSEMIVDSGNAPANFIKTIELDGYALHVTSQDANGLIDVNKADEKLLDAALFSVTGSRHEADMIRDRILDWRDDDSDRRYRGAEHAEYSRAGLNLGPGDTDFTEVDQLRQVLGIGPDLFRMLKPMLTVYSDNGEINPESAPASVQAALKLLRTEVTDGRNDRMHSGLQSNFTGNPEQNERQSNPINPSKTLTTDAGRVRIISIKLGGKLVRNGPILSAAVMPSSDPKAPYRLLNWRLDEIYEGPGE